jgi:hypothetical protein
LLLCFKDAEYGQIKATLPPTLREHANDCVPAARGLNIEWMNGVAADRKLTSWSIFHRRQHEQIKKRIYNTRNEAWSEVFDYIEGFYNRVRRHKHLDQLSPHEFERKRQTAL